MVNVVKGGGRAPPTLTSQANFTLMMECTPESGRYHSVYSVVATGTRHFSRFDSSVCCLFRILIRIRQKVPDPDPGGSTTLAKSTANYAKLKIVRSYRMPRGSALWRIHKNLKNRTSRVPVYRAEEEINAWKWLTTPSWNGTSSFPGGRVVSLPGCRGNCTSTAAGASAQREYTVAWIQKYTGFLG